jgi:TPR repeat protein
VSCTDSKIAIAAASVARRGDALAMTAVRRRLSAIWLAVLTCIGTASIAHADALARGTAAYSRGDYNRAARELEPLARRGNAKAFALLGFLYEHGFGEPKAYPVAAGLYAQGAARGDPFGQAMLGLLYDKGYGVPQDFVLAYKWLDLAAAHATGPQRDAYARFRDAVGSKMSPNEIAEGQRLATYWTAVAWVPPGWADSRPRRE